MNAPLVRRSLRILHVVDLMAVGGVESYTRSLLSELGTRGHRNVVFGDGEGLSNVSAPGTVVHQFHGLGVADAEHGRLLVAQAVRAMEADPPDVAFVHCGLNPALGRFIVRSVPSVVFAHEYSTFCPGGALLYETTDSVCPLWGVPNWRCLTNAYLRRCNTRRPGRLLASYRRTRSQNRFLGLVDAVVCDSEYVRRRLLENVALPADHVEVLPAPAAVSAVVAEHGSREPIVLFVGRVTPQKGLRYLIRALALVRRPARLIVVGDGYELPRIRALNEELGLSDRVEYAGILDREEVGRLYRRATVLVVPSVWPEPWGMVGPEAMASGLPVIAFRSGGIPEWLLDGQTGFLVEPRDVEGLAARIEQVLADPTLSRRLGARGRAVARNRFTIAGHVDALEAVFQQAISRHHRRGGDPQPGTVAEAAGR